MRSGLIRDLKFSQHIAKKVDKANSMLALIKRTFEYLDNHSFSRLYTELVRTHLEFADVVWHPYSKTSVKWPLSKRPKSVFQDQLSLNASQKYCRTLQGEHSAILSTFIKLPFVIKIFVLSIFEWKFYTGFALFTERH